MRDDEYRCQVHEVEDPEGDGTWLKGYEFVPDQKSIVHHSIIYVAPDAARPEIAQISARDELPGWTCFGLSNLNTPGVYSIGGWAPGRGSPPDPPPLSGRRALRHRVLGRSEGFPLTAYFFLGTMGTGGLARFGVVESSSASADFPYLEFAGFVMKRIPG